MTTETDHILLRRTFALSAEAKRAGNFPYACVLADPSGKLILEAKNGIMTGKNHLNHAEMVLLLEACSAFSFEALQSFTIYTSAEPCPMCAAAIYWSGIGRLVYGLSSERKNKLNNGSGHISMNRPVREVIACGNRPMEITGPLLEDEAWVSVDGHSN
ncbi:nucleoside deaminase [Terrimonas pollutisoli]|uniref:nucleoside deaminase n=1 Tax=Terrimonas pollutisoli TaxID=3034147 RepID=UPI0023EDA169|nr:nucleoside deaminase [Terrimonas sp. H1YJ31]